MQPATPTMSSGRRRLSRVLADGAGVEQDGVGLVRAVRERHAGTFEHAGHQLAVRHVHLAAVGFKEYAIHGAANHSTQGE